MTYDISLVKKDPCLEALKAIKEDGKVKSGKKPDEKKKTDKKDEDSEAGADKERDKKSGGFFRKLFRREK